LEVNIKMNRKLWVK